MPPMGSPMGQQGQGGPGGMYNNGAPNGPPGGPHPGQMGPNGPMDPNMAMRMKAQGRYRMGNPGGGGGPGVPGVPGPGGAGGPGMRPGMPPGAIRPGQQMGPGPMGGGQGGPMNQHMMPNQGMRQVKLTCPHYQLMHDSNFILEFSIQSYSVPPAAPNSLRLQK